MLPVKIGIYGIAAAIEETEEAIASSPIYIGVWLLFALRCCSV